MGTWGGPSVMHLRQVTQQHLAHYQELALTQLTTCGG
jgi:hypothetical protein